MLKEVEYCKCEEVTSVCTETNERGQWDMCSVCGKPIEGSIVNFAQFERG